LFSGTCGAQTFNQPLQSRHFAVGGVLFGAARRLTLASQRRGRNAKSKTQRAGLFRVRSPEDSMLSSTTIYFNKKNEEVARITFDENDVPGWCIKSKSEPGFRRKFAAQREASAVWLREFDPETGKLRAKSQRKELSNAY
jgi:hypothetical protein